MQRVGVAGEGEQHTGVGGHLPAPVPRVVGQEQHVVGFGNASECFFQRTCGRNIFPLTPRAWFCHIVRACQDEGVTVTHEQTMLIAQHLPPHALLKTNHLVCGTTHLLFGGEAFIDTKVVVAQD